MRRQHDRAETERLFAEYARRRDPEVARRLVEANLGLAAAIVRTMDHTEGRLRADLLQEATLGLCEAVRRFDLGRGVTFATYATFWIKAYVRNFLRNNARVVRFGRSRAERAAYSRGELPPVELSLDVRPPVGGDTLGDRIADQRPPADDLLTVVEIAGRSRALARKLGPRARVILQERLMSDEPQPLRRLARRWSLSGERVRQLEADLLHTLRTTLTDRHLTAA